jgi:outer membrane protein OmpA-like peptidoglycan-associated protein
LPPLPDNPADQPPPPATSLSTVVALPEPPPGAAVPAPSTPGRIVFEGASTELSPSAQGVLDDMARRLGERENARLALRSYATLGSGTPVQARQVSLARALAARAYLMGKGVRGTRIDVQALGSTADSDPRDRIDLMLMD